MSTDYSAASWTASDLLADVYRKCAMPPTGTIDHPPDEVLKIASSCIHDWAGHLLSSAGQGRAVTVLTRAITSDARDVNGLVYELPPMALADTVDAVTWLDSTTNTERRLSPISREMEAVFVQPSSSGCPEVYAFEDGTIRVLPRPTQGGSLRIQYKRRHGQLVIGGDTSAVLSIASASAGAATDITLASVPSSFVVGAWIDIMGRYLPYRTKVHGARITAVSSPTVTVAVAYADVLAWGVADDTAVIYGKTPYVQVPLEMREGLTSHIGSRVSAEVGDMTLANTLDGIAGAAGGRLQTMLSPRSTQPQKAFNPRSLARGGMRRRWPGDWR